MQGLDLPPGDGETPFPTSTLLDLEKGLEVQCLTSVLAVLPRKPAVSFCPRAGQPFQVLEGCGQHRQGARAELGTVAAAPGTPAEVPDA